MNYNISLAIIDGATKGDYFVGGVVAIVATVMVFLVLLLIIFLTDLASNSIESATKEESAAPVETRSAAPVNAPVSTPAVVAGSPLNINDEDATIAALVASIDYRAETGMNIRVVSVKEVG